MTSGVFRARRTVHGPLVRPQDVDRGQEHPGHGDGSPHPVVGERPQDHQELADEVVQAREAHRRQTQDQEHGRHPRGDLRQAAHLAEITGPGPFVQQPHHDEERTRR